MHGRPAPRAGQVLVAVRLVGVVAVAVEVQEVDGNGGRQESASAARVLVAVAVRRVVALVRGHAPEGLPGREQLGGLELELLHRDVSGHGASLGAIAPRARQPGGFTCSAPLWRRATNLVYAICRT